MRVNRHHPRIIYDFPGKQKRPASKKLQDRLPTSSVATVFFPWKCQEKKHISPKAGEKWCFTQGRLLEKLHVLKLHLQIIHGNRRDPPPRMAYLRDNGGSIVPEKRPAISWGFTWPWEGGWAPLDCHGMLGISPNISRKARPSASCAMPRKPTVFRTWSWRGLKFNTGASPPQ